jgi:hypothetical protein
LWVSRYAFDLQRVYRYAGQKRGGRMTSAKLALVR